jgi:methylmalonyl-CoA/ethylmalonyl-CoA epimerase
MLRFALVAALTAACATPALSQTAPETIGSHGLAQVAVQVKDLPRAIAFYQNTLGMKYLFTAGPQPMVFFGLGDSRLMLEPGEPGHSTTLYIDDPQIEAHKVALEARGVKFLGPMETLQRNADYELKLLEFTDPDGNPLALMGKTPAKR